MTKISVIVPNYNHARYLNQRMDSIIQQTITDFEIILLDDASTDDSVAIMNSYTDNRITKRLYSGKNSGSPFVQWERGVREARGEWIWIAESDDYSDPGFLQSIWNAINGASNCVLAFCRSTVVAPDENRLGRFESDHIQWSSDTDFEADGIKFCTELLYRGNVLLNAGAALFRKDAFLKCISSIPKLRMSTDWLIWWHVAQQGNVRYVSQPLNYFRRDGGNVSTDWQSERTAVYRYFANTWPHKSDNKSEKLLEKYMFDLLVNKHWRVAQRELSQSSWVTKRRVLIRFIKFKARL